MKVLIVAAHPDDEIIGVGGTARRHIEAGDSVTALILSKGVTSRKDQANNTTAHEQEKKELIKQARRAAEKIGQDIIFLNFPDNRFDSVDLLDIVKEVENHVKSYSPDVIYTHWKYDLNVDHRLTFDAVITACRPCSSYFVKNIYSFETISNTEWSIKHSFNPNVFINITNTMRNKLEALAYYKHEIREYPHPRSLEGIAINNQRWGLVMAGKYFEAFELVRTVKW